ncbi:MAG: HD-GYP domain-containing protein [Nitrospira sp.]|nr:HD-GYP domain-containing protein [Nitrospira sp.]MCP9462306.1 HD-GYP domain-containing protein [Nitrospira sp.]MCP9474889.1 HD-GYP domain-containing protein [Nitrospira sp.]
MNKRIAVDELRPGMRVVAIDRSWLVTPFLSHRLTIASREQVEQLKACGVQIVEIIADDAGEEEIRQDEHDRSAKEGGEAVSLGSAGDVTPEPASFDEELKTAKEVYRAAKAVIQGAMQDVRLGRAINMEAVDRVVSDMAESVLRNLDALTSLSRLKRFDEYTFYHSVNTSLLAMSLGRDLGFTKSELHQIGVGALLHDIGKTKIPNELLNKPGRFEPDEMELMKQHVLRGVEILSNLTGLAEAHAKPALEHHERVDGTGYPFGRSKDEISRFGLMASIVDIYDAITSDRCYHRGRPPHDALQYLYLLSLKGHLDAGLVQRFIRVVGVFPVGSLVELNTGEVAVVRRVHREAPLAPHVIIVKSASNVLLSKPIECDLREETKVSGRAIRAVTGPHDVGIDPSVYLDREPI